MGTRCMSTTSFSWDQRRVRLNMSWGPGGSVGYELASGIPAFRDGSASHE
jgi:hypothetical protein